jgi:hypothetical protein
VDRLENLSAQGSTIVSSYKSGFFFNIILFGARVFQQWAVDMYIKMETMRLDFYSKPKNQKLIRADLYQVS